MLSLAFLAKGFKNTEENIVNNPIVYLQQWRLPNQVVQRDTHNFMRFLFYFWSFAKIANIKVLTPISHYL